MKFFQKILFLYYDKTYISMKRLFITFLVSLFFIGCEVYNFPPEYDVDYNPFYRTQWTAIDEDGTTLRNKVVIFDFDYYYTNSLTIYSPEVFTTQSYKTFRPSESVWTIDNYYYNESYCKIVLKTFGPIDNIRNINVIIYNSSNFIVKEFILTKNDEIVDINKYLQ